MLNPKINNTMLEVKPVSEVGQVAATSSGTDAKEMGGGAVGEPIEGASEQGATVSTPPRPREAQQTRPALRTTVSPPLGPSTAPRPTEPQDSEADLAGIQRKLLLVAGLGCLSVGLRLTMLRNNPEVGTPLLVFASLFLLAAAAPDLHNCCRRPDLRSATGSSDDVHQSPMNASENA